MENLWIAGVLVDISSMRVPPTSSTNAFGQGPHAERVNRDGRRRQHHEQQQGQPQTPEHEPDVVELHKQTTPTPPPPPTAKAPAAPVKKLDLSA